MTTTHVIAYIDHSGGVHASASRAVRFSSPTVTIHVERFRDGIRSSKVGRIPVSRRRDETARGFAARLASAAKLACRL